MSLNNNLLALGSDSVWNRVRYDAWIGALAILLLLVSARAALGQVATGELTGTITDAKGAAMSGVTVTVHNEGTGIDAVEKSNDSGVYTAPLLQPGIYDITAMQPGFATVQNKGITLQVGATVRIDIMMPVASQQSLVTVTTEAPVLETEKTEQAETVSENLVADLPIGSRRWEQFTLLTPGVASDGAGKIAFHGINSMYNTNSVDGASNDQTEDGTVRGGTSDGYTYSTDSIREFRVSSSNFTAELGHAAGGAVNAVTKSGTNGLHGDVFENFRNPIFNALDPVSASNALSLGLTPTQSVHQQNQFGGSVGGPLIKDKIFYFVTYDGYRKSTPIAFTTNNPVAALACPSEITALQCTAAKGFVNSQLGSFPRLLTQDIGLGKIDYQVTQSNHVNATFNWRNWQEPISTSFASAANSGLTSNQNNFYQDRFIIISWDKVISTDKVNELRYQYSQDHSFQSWPSSSQIPNISLSNIFSYGQVNSIPNFTNEDRHQITDTFSFVKGRHSFKAGVDLNFVHVSLHSATPSSGQYQYSGAVTGSLTTLQFTTATGCSGSTDIIFCDWLLDLYAKDISDGRFGKHWSSYGQAHDLEAPGNSNGQLVPAFVDIFETYEHAAYFQDSWKMRPNLTVNLGVRYDLQILPGIPFPNTTTAIDAAYTTKVNVDYGGVQPRVGVAWNFSKNNVLRVGFGTFMSKTNGSEVSATRRLAFRGQTLNCSPTAGGICAPLLFPDLLYNQAAWNVGVPFTISGAPPGSQPLGATVLNPPGNPCLGNINCAISALSPGLVNPRAIEGEVVFERQLPGNMSLAASYILTRGEHLPNFWDANLAPPTATKTYDVVNATGVTQSTSTVPFFTNRIDPTTGSILAAFSVVSSWYNGMVLTLHKPMSHGIELLANYTLSYSTDSGESTGNVGGEGNDSGIGVLNPYNLSAEEGRSSLDARNRFTASVVWAPAYAKSLSNRYERGVLGGWNLSSTVTATNGTPYSAAVQGSSVLCLGAVAQPCTGSVSGIDGGMTAALLSTSRGPMGGRVAFLPRDSFNLPSYADVDLRITRRFIVHEYYDFEFRAEAFNLFNNTFVQAVNTSAYSPVQPGTTSATCPSATHTNTCMVPVSSFQTPTTTSNYLLGSRQLQFGFRFEF